MAVATEAPSASAVRPIVPTDPAAMLTIELTEITVLRWPPPTSRWSSVMCSGFEAPWTV